MGLEGTSIQDHTGASLYVLYDGTTLQERHWQHFNDKVRSRTKHQVHLISIRDKDGEYLRTLYGLAHSQLPVVMIVRDDDQVAHSWSSTEHPTVEHVVAILNQISH